MITFTVPAVPVPQPRQRHRVLTIKNRVMAKNYTPGNHPVQAFKATVRMALQERYKGPPLDGPVVLMLWFYLPRPRRMLWKNRPMPSVPHTSRPDADNLAKAVKDAMSGLAWIDDSQVSTMHVEKMYAAGDGKPCVVIGFKETP